MAKNSKNPNQAKNSIPQVFLNKRLIHDITNILLVKPGMRNMFELRKLSNFLERCNIFKNIQEPERLRELCNCVKLVECYKGETICKQGEIGEHFYIILQGAVNGYVDKKRGDGIPILKEIAKDG